MFKEYLSLIRHSLAGDKFKLRLEFPAGYPYQPPKVKFTSACFHPNVDNHGNICLDILKENWSALYDVRTLLLSIQNLLGECEINTRFLKETLILVAIHKLYYYQFLRRLGRPATSMAKFESPNLRFLIISVLYFSFCYGQQLLFS